MLKQLSLFPSLLILTTVFSCSDYCRNDILHEYPNPKKELTAILFIRDCGAKSSAAKQLSIIPSDEKLSNYIGNTFVADSNFGEIKEDSLGGPFIEVYWKTPDTLMVRYSKGSRIFTQKDRIEDVYILYNTFE